LKNLVWIYRGALICSALAGGALLPWCQTSTSNMQSYVLQVGSWRCHAKQPLPRWKVMLHDVWEKVTPPIGKLQEIIIFPFLAKGNTRSHLVEES